MHAFALVYMLIALMHSKHRVPDRESVPTVFADVEVEYSFCRL